MQSRHLAVGMLMMVAAGCATNPIVGQAGPLAERFHGDVGVVGYGTDLTIARGSQVPKLSIMGDNCKVTVEDGAALGRIEFWGNGNTVTLPERLNVSVARVGTNQIVRRTQGQVPTTKSASDTD